MLLRQVRARAAGGGSSGESALRSSPTISAAWWARSFSVASSTARRVRTSASPSVIATESATIAPIAANSRVRRLRDRSVSRHELVPRAAHGADRLGAAELPPELRDVLVDGARAAGVGHPPHDVEQALAREHDARGARGSTRAGRTPWPSARSGSPSTVTVARVAPHDDLAGGEHVVREPGSARRRIALIRAASSRGENGFGT